MEEKDTKFVVFKPRDIKDLTKDWGFLGRLDSSVFVCSAIICFGFIVWGVLAYESLGNALNAILGYITTDWGWMFSAGVFFFIPFLLILAFSKYGKRKLGKDDDVPEYSTFSWFSMIFGCGMGVGLIFWGVGEPIYHFLFGPAYGGAAGSAQAAEYSLAISFLHWGFSPWAIYLVIAVPMGIIIYRKGLPALISSIFYPVLGDRIYGAPGKAINILALTLTFFGMSTTIGFGVMQLGAGFSYNYGFASGFGLYVPILIVCCIGYLASATLPIAKGIRVGSNISMVATLGLMLFLFIMGPTLYILNSFVNSTGIYLQNFVQMSLWTDPVEQTGWLGGWTVFYWAWWIAWAPFVGMFLAKISKGRTVRALVIAGLIAPTLFDMIFFAIFGATAVNFEMGESTKGMLLDAISTDVAQGIYALFDQFPASGLIAPVILFVCFTFFVVSADSCTIVLGMISTGGDENPKTSIKILWGIGLALSAGVLLLIGGLKPIQTVSIVAAFPFIFVMFGICYSTIKMLRTDQHYQLNAYTSPPVDEGELSKATE